MSRSTLGIVAGVLLLGCVVALLPAQESSRRTASKYRPSASAETTERPNLSPPAAATEENLPPVVLPPGRAPGALPRSSFVPANQATESAAATAPATLPTTVPHDPLTAAAATTVQTPSSPADGGHSDESGLRSVLKRARPLSAPPAQASSPHAPANVPAPEQTPAAVGAVTASETNSLTPPSSTFSSELTRRTGDSGLSLPASSPASAASAVASTGSARTTSKSASLKVEITGPPGITVGKPALFVVTVTNESETAADEVHLRIPLPTSITVQNTQPSSGEAAVQADPTGVNRLVWLVPRVAARAKEQLKLQLVTRDGDSFDLAAEWTVKPAVAKTAIVVKQPQLALSLAGPAEMIFGDEKAFTLTISNPGTGDAERVVVSVTAANAPPQQFDAGIIPAGHKKEVPIAVVASQPGSIELQVAAAAEGGLEARTAGKVIVRKADVKVAIDGPSAKYAGSDAVYAITVVNSGSAAADSVNLSLTLPAGAKYLGGIDNAAATATSVKWKIANLPAAAERQYEVRLQLNSPGANLVAIESQAAASGVATAAATTQVEAVADLKLVVHDPAGPLPTDAATTYELQVLNRGSQSAKNIKILVQFSDGIEPVSFEGCDAQIVPGQVVCKPLPQLGPGEQATVRVKAKAHDPGNHHFRIEVTTTEGDARLVSEGTTRFFVDAGRGGQAASTARKPNLLPNTSIPTTIR